MQPAEEDLSTDSSDIFPPCELLEAATTPTGGAPFQTLPTPDPPPFPTPNGSRILDASSDLPPPPLDLLPPPANGSLVLGVTASELPPPPSEASSPSFLPSCDPVLSSHDDALYQSSTICDSESGLSPGELGRRFGSFLAVFFWASRIRIRIRNLFVQIRLRLRIRILPSTSKKMKKNLDFYCFVTSL